MKDAIADYEATEYDHVDYFINSYYRKETYARFVLMHYRLPAALKIDFKRFMASFDLYCHYKGETFRVTGASAMGDVWLSRDFTATDGYDLRVLWKDCSEWSAVP